MHAYRDPLPGSPPTTQPGAPPAYLEEYQRVCKVPKAPKFRQPPPSLAMANYVQSDVNPSVALDKESKKYRILLFKDGIPTALGMFNTGEECVEGVELSFLVPAQFCEDFRSVAVMRDVVDDGRIDEQRYDSR